MAQAGRFATIDCPVRPLALEASQLRRRMLVIERTDPLLHDRMQARFEDLAHAAARQRAHSPEGILFQVLIASAAISALENWTEDVGPLREVRESWLCVENLVMTLRDTTTQPLLDYYLVADFDAARKAA